MLSRTSVQVPTTKMDYIRLTALLFLFGVASSAAQNVVGDCADVYDTGTGNCQVSLDLVSEFQLGSAASFLPLQNGCGDCFNGNGRSSDEKFNVVKCPIDDPTGYYCNPEGESFACMDWTFGSNKMMQAEETFNRRV